MAQGPGNSSRIPHGDTVKSGLKKYYWLALLILLAVFGVLLLAVPNIYLDQDTQREKVILTITRDLGSGLLLAAIFGFTVEFYFSRRREEQTRVLQEEINADVFSAVLGQNLPASINREMDVHILQQPFLREDVKITVDFQPCSAHSDHLRSDITIQYQVRNLSSYKREFPINSGLDCEVAEDDCKPKFESVTTQLSSHKAIPLSAAEINKCCKDDGRVVRFKKSLNMEAKDADNSVANIEIQAVQCQPTRNTSQWGMTSMTDRLELIYTLGTEYEVKGSPNHPSQELFHESHTGGTHRFEIWGGILPYQGITVTWSPRDLQPQP